MKTDDDEQSQTRQEDIHEDPEGEKQKQNNQGDSCQREATKDQKEKNARLSI